MHKFFGFIAAILSLLFTQAYATKYPLTVTDDLGHKVILQKEPKRIISVLPSTTETVCALGLCDRLVGVDKWSDYPMEVLKLPKAVDLYNPNIEWLIALKPDLVLISKYGKLEKSLKQLGIPALAIQPETYDEVFSKTTRLGHILNREKQAEDLAARMRNEIKDIEKLTKSVLNKPTLYYEIDPTPYSAGPNSFIGTLLKKAGAKNIIPANLGNYPRIEPEVVIKANPQLLLGLSLDIALQRPGWQNIYAVKDGHVYQIPKELQTLLGRPGPRLPQALKGLARLIHPELFPVSKPNSKHVR